MIRILKSLPPEPMKLVLPTPMSAWISILDLATRADRFDVRHLGEPTIRHRGDRVDQKYR